MASQTSGVHLAAGPPPELSSPVRPCHPPSESRATSRCPESSAIPQLCLHHTPNLPAPHLHASLLAAAGLLTISPHPLAPPHVSPRVIFYRENKYDQYKGSLCNPRGPPTPLRLKPGKLHSLRSVCPSLGLISPATCCCQATCSGPPHCSLNNPELFPAQGLALTVPVPKCPGLVPSYPAGLGSDAASRVRQLWSHRANRALLSPSPHPPALHTVALALPGISC